MQKCFYFCSIIITISSYKTPANTSYCLFSFHCWSTYYGLCAFGPLKDSWLKVNTLCEKCHTKTLNWSFQTGGYPNILTSATTNWTAGTRLMGLFTVGSPIGSPIKDVLHQKVSQSCVFAIVLFLDGVIVGMNGSVFNTKSIVWITRQKVFCLIVYLLKITLLRASFGVCLFHTTVWNLK